MNIANVMSRFASLANIDSSQAQQWRALAEDACQYIASRCVVKQPDSAQTARLEMLAAAYTLKLYGMCGDDELTGFTAGDVRLTSSADRRERSESLWRELAANNADLIGAEGFIFGRVIS